MAPTEVLPAMSTSCVAKLTAERISVFAEAGTVTEKLPSLAVLVPRFVPLTATVAPATGTPFASVTVPEIVRFWAVACPISKAKQHRKKRSLLIRSCLVVKKC
jgi:hypothetical protein